MTERIVFTVVITPNLDLGGERMTLESWKEGFRDDLINEINSNWGQTETSGVSLEVRRDAVVKGLQTCLRCGCCSLRGNGECAGPCTPCGHHPIDECPNCEDKEVDIRKLRDFVQNFTTAAQNEFHL